MITATLRRAVSAWLPKRPEPAEPGPDFNLYQHVRQLRERGVAMLHDYAGPAIQPAEWLNLDYVDWKSGGDTNFAPIASADGSMECRGFHEHGLAEKNGIWTANAERCPALVAWAKSVGARFGRVRVVRLKPQSEAEAILNLHTDHNNRLNPAGTGWVVRAWFELSDTAGSYMLLRDTRSNNRRSVIPLHRNRQFVLDSERMLHAVVHPGPAPRYALIVSLESSDALERWIAQQMG